MGKPNGISLGLSKSGPTMRVTRATRAGDAIWDAVQAARSSGWTAKEFRREVEQAWREDARQEAVYAKKEARRVFGD